MSVPHPQVPVADVDHLIASAQFLARFVPGEQGDQLRSALATARADEEFIADIWPIVADAIDLNRPIVARFIAALKRKAARSK